MKSGVAGWLLEVAGGPAALLQLIAVAVVHAESLFKTPQAMRGRRTTTRVYSHLSCRMSLRSDVNYSSNLVVEVICITCCYRRCHLLCNCPLAELKKHGCD